MFEIGQYVKVKSGLSWSLKGIYKVIEHKNDYLIKIKNSKRTEIFHFTHLFQDSDCKKIIRNKKLKRIIYG